MNCAIARRPTGITSSGRSSSSSRCSQPLQLPISTALGTRTTINFDLYNTTNANTVLTLNNGYVPQASGLARWQVPNAVLQPRFFKIGAQFDF